MLLLCKLQDNKTEIKKRTKSQKSHPNKLVKPIISLPRQENNEFDTLEYIDNTCHIIPEDTTSGESKSQDFILVLLKSGSSS